MVRPSECLSDRVRNGRWWRLQALQILWWTWRFCPRQHDGGLCPPARTARRVRVGDVIPGTLPRPRLPAVLHGEAVLSVAAKRGHSSSHVGVQDPTRHKGGSGLSSRPLEFLAPPYHARLSNQTKTKILFLLCVLNQMRKIFRGGLISGSISTACTRLVPNPTLINFPMFCITVYTVSTSSQLTVVLAAFL